jgi:hypothetical protein
MGPKRVKGCCVRPWRLGGISLIAGLVATAGSADNDVVLSTRGSLSMLGAGAYTCPLFSST